MKKIFNSKEVVFISDTHFDHKNIIEYCQRPYTKDTVDDMNTKMLNSLMAADAAGKTIFHMGDFTFGDKFLKRFGWRPMNQHYIILGNHDKHADEGGSLRKLYREFFTHIIGSSRTWKTNVLDIYIEDTHQELLLTHEPRQQLMPNQINVYGHHHNNMFTNLDYFMPTYEWIFDGKKRINVSVELTNYQVVSYDELSTVPIVRRSPYKE